MTPEALTARELQRGDIELIADYWSSSSGEFLVGMGVDLNKLPDRGDLIEMLSSQLGRSLEDRQSYCTIWEVNDEPIGHCNVNRIEIGSEAYMHLHLWRSDLRFKGRGSILVRKSLPFFFGKLGLRDLYCEPNAQNVAPNRVLEKAGFDFIRECRAVPGAINFEQSVKCWHMSREKFAALGALI